MITPMANNPNWNKVKITDVIPYTSIHLRYSTPRVELCRDSVSVHTKLDSFLDRTIAAIDNANENAQKQHIVIKNESLDLRVSKPSPTGVDEVDEVNMTNLWDLAQ